MLLAALMSPRLTRRIHRTPRAGSDPGDEPDVVELESVELSGVFSAPQWLRDLGFASWLLAGVGAVLIGATWVAALTSTIVVPVVVAGVVAAVTSPLVRMLQRRGVPRAAGAALVFLGLLVLGAAFVVMIVGGISSQASDLAPKLAQGADKIQGWLQDLGVSSDSAQQANSDAGSGLSDGFHALVTGVATGVEALASLAVFLSFTALSLFFFLKDGPVIRAWAERHLGVPRPVGHIVVSRTLQSLRGYFVGVTAVAAFNGDRHRPGGAHRRRAPGGVDRGRELRGRLHPVPRCLEPQGRSPCSSRSARREPTRPSPWR